MLNVAAAGIVAQSMTNQYVSPVTTRAPYYDMAGVVDTACVVAQTSFAAMVARHLLKK